MTDLSAVQPQKMEGTSSHTAMTSSVTSGSSSSDPMEDFWNLDLSDLLDMPEGPSIIIPPFQRSFSADDTASMKAAREAVNKASPNTSANLRTGAAPDKRDVRRTKSNKEDTCTSTGPVVSQRKPNNDIPPVRKSRKDRSKSPIRFPKLGRSKTCSPGRSSSSKEDTSTTTRATGEPLKRSVSFDKVQVREFQQILAENPCTEEGPSLGLGWNYHEKKDKDLDKYESKKNGKKNTLWGMTSTTTSGPRISSLSPLERTEKALQLGYSPQQILNNQKQNQKIQEQRRKTLKDYDAVAIIKNAKAAHGFR